MTFSKQIVPLSAIQPGWAVSSPRAGVSYGVKLGTEDCYSAPGCHPAALLTRLTRLICCYPSHPSWAGEAA